MPDRGQTVEVEWRRIPLYAAIIPTACAVVATVQRHALWPPRLPALFALLAVMPFLLDAIAYFGPARLRLPPLLFSAVVIGATTPLILRPVNIDIVPFILVFLCAEMITRIDTVQGVAVCLASAGVLVGAEVSGHFNGSFIWITAIALSSFGAYAMRSQLLLTAQLRAVQADLAERSAAEERARIAREVHDVIAHSMSVTMLHITAARMALEREQSSAALESLREAEAQGRNSLNDIRRTVGLLGPDEKASAPPMPTVSDLTKLVSDFRNAGLDVTLELNGDVETVPPGIGLNLYRIAQESLTNAAKHAPGAEARVSLDVARDICLRVHNNTSNGARTVEPDGGGLGIPGMTERAALLGGSLRAGPDTANGGWLVSVIAPRPAVGTT